MSVYIPSKSVKTDPKFFSKAMKLNKNLLFLGDFNSKHTDFGNKENNNNGIILKNTIDKLGLILINNNSTPTYISANNGACDVLDFALATPTLAGEVINHWVGEDCGSDHLPLFIETTLTSHVEYTTETRYQYSKTNWNLYKKTLNQNLNTICWPDIIENELDVELISDSIITALTNAREKSTPIASPFKKKEYWKITPKIQGLIKYRHKLKRLFAQTRDSALKKEINHIHSVIRKEIEVQKSIQFAAFIGKMNDPKDTWKIYNAYTGKNKRQTIPNLVTPTGISKTNKEKADTFAAHLNNIFQEPNDPSFDDKFKKVVEKAVENDKHVFETVFPVKMSAISKRPPIKLLKFSEVQLKIKKLKNTSPGQDTITNGMLKNGTEKLVMCLTKLFNISLCTGYLPASWKSSEILMFPKPDKIHTIPENYRPISLTSVICKLMERLIQDKINRYMSKHKKWNNTQSGFTTGRSTLEHLYRLNNCVENGFRYGKCTLAVMLDVEKAFDKLWLDGIKFKMLAYGIHRSMIKWISGFLTNRKGQVSINGVHSNPFTPMAGVPQGSVLGPLLFKLYVNDIPPGNTLNTSNSQFADDMGYWTCARSVKVCNQRLRRNLFLIEKYCALFRIKINPKKTQVILFSRKRSYKEGDVSLTYNNQKLEVVKEAKFLGITFDNRLNWNKHTEITLSRANKRLNALKILGCKKYGAGKKALLTLYQGSIRPLFEYGFPILKGLHPSKIQKFQVIQNKAIRIAMGVPGYYSTKYIHEYTKIQFLKDRQENIKSKYLVKFRKLNLREF